MIRAARLAALALVPALPLSGQDVPTLVPLATAGCALCDGPEALGEVQALALDASGRIFVADRDEPHVRVFAPDGRPLRAFGRTGEGPGEVRLAVGLLPDDRGGVSLLDMRLGRLTAWDSLGTVIDSRRVDRFPLGLLHHPGARAALFTFADWGRMATGVARLDPGAGETTVVLETLSWPPAPDGHQAPVTPPWAGAPGGGFAVGDGEGEYRIRVFDGSGRAVRDVFRDVARIRRSPEEMEREREALRRRTAAMGRAVASSPEGGVAAPEPEPFRRHFLMHALAFDDAGRLWVRTERGDEGRTVFDLFAPDGRFLGEVVVPGRLRQYAVRAGRLAAVVVGENDVQTVGLWRVDAR